MEHWKTFYEYDTKLRHNEYQVSSEGRIRNLTTGRYRKPILNKVTGYEYVSIQTFEGSKRIEHHWYLHRLVADAFIPNPDNKPCIDHIDNNPSNNQVENLRWVTYKENNSTQHHKVSQRLTLALKPKNVNYNQKPYKKTALTLLLEKIVPL